jgi:hypothetical protein
MTAIRDESNRQRALLVFESAVGFRIQKGSFAVCRYREQLPAAGPIANLFERNSSLTPQVSRRMSETCKHQPYLRAGISIRDAQ